MTRTALVLAAAILAGTTLTTAANAGGGVRLGFGFPLGSFVAHPNQNYSGGGGGGGGYDQPRRRQQPPHVARYRDDTPAPRRVKRAVPQTSVAAAPQAPKASPKAPATSVATVTPVKLNDKLPTNSTDVAKASVETKRPAIDTTTTTAVLSKAPISNNDNANVTGSSSEDTSEATTDQPGTDKIAAVDKTTTETKSNETADGKRVCRRFSPAIAGLVDVPCE